jgi:hypothetical protein
MASEITFRTRDLITCFENNVKEKENVTMKI